MHDYKKLMAGCRLVAQFPPRMTEITVRYPRTISAIKRLND